MGQCGVLFFSILHSIVTPEMKMKQNLSALIKLILAVIRPLNNIIQEHGRWAEELYSRRKLFALITPEWKTFILVEWSNFCLFRFSKTCFYSVHLCLQFQAEHFQLVHET